MKCPLVFVLLLSVEWARGAALIRTVAEPSQLERLAAKEIRRYIQLRTGELLSITNGVVVGDQIIVARKDRAVVGAGLGTNGIVAGLGAQQYRLETLEGPEGRVLWVVGGDDVGTLYGAYRLVERLGVRFYLHGDVVPDERMGWGIPQVEETGRPLFELRGITPFHDFPEGPDWWEEDDYLAHVSQLAKMRMNFVGFHCYPERGRGPEPLVWIGLPGDVDGLGRVSWCYQAQWHSTVRDGMWGYAGMRSGEFTAGAHLLFPWDEFGHSLMAGMLPAPGSFEEGNRLFDGVGRMLDTVFSRARVLGVKTCVGTETPMTVPGMVRKRLAELGKDPVDPAVLRELYEGTFRRIQASHPLDYYWLWTPEVWTWGGYNEQEFERVKQDIAAAAGALSALGNPFQLAACGWVLGPVNDRTALDRILPVGAPMGCINREVGHAGVETAFARIAGRPKWAVPWLENDWSMTAPQLWAGRMRYDAADARRLGCTGLFGLHWRSKIIAPNFAALAAAGWDQSWVPAGFDPAPVPAGFVGPEASVMTGFRGEVGGEVDPYVYTTMRCNVDGYVAEVPEGRYVVTLKFCEGEAGRAGERVFGVKLQGKRVVERLDVFERAGPRQPLDLVFTNIVVEDGRLRIDFVREAGVPCLSAFTVEGMTAGGEGVAAERWSMRINCSGLHYQDYSQDLFVERLPDWNRDRSMPVGEFYLDFARASFGEAAAAVLGGIFAGLDGSGMPEPAVWREGGPGYIKPNSLSWEVVKRDYSFVDDFAAVRPRVSGAGNEARFDYWLNVFRCMRAMARVGCIRGELDLAMAEIRSLGDRKEAVVVAARAVETRSRLIGAWEEMMRYHLGATDTTGALGTIANFEQHNRGAYRYLNHHDEALSQVLGVELRTVISGEYVGEPRLTIPTVRTHAVPGEVLGLRVFAMDREPMKRAEVRWRRLGVGEFQSVPLHHVSRAVYRGALPIEREDIEYYVEVETRGGRRLLWPPGAPDLNQTVVVIE